MRERERDGIRIERNHLESRKKRAQDRRRERERLRKCQMQQVCRSDKEILDSNEGVDGYNLVVAIQVHNLAYRE